MRSAFGRRRIWTRLSSASFEDIQRFLKLSCGQRLTRHAPFRSWEELRRQIAIGDCFECFTCIFSTRSERDLLHRLHQYARCIDGLVLTRSGKGAADFKTRTGLFIGTGCDVMMGEIYGDRSTVEHLNEDRLLEPFDREKRLELLRKEAIVEFVARTALQRIMGNEGLWPHFANRNGLEQFWALTADEQRAIWGAPVNVLEPLADYEPEYIHDGNLRS
jgi:hypothetical protein